MSDSTTPSKERPARKLLRHRIEKHLKRQAEEQRKEMLRRRIEIAKEGVALYQKGNLIDSMKKYQQYLLILEMWKKCGRDGLLPDHFDKKRDVYELVLISGIYWDMAKLYDRAKKTDQKAELTVALQKYLVFSKGFPYQPLSAEALRRYLGSGRCKHRAEFKKAYQSLSGDKCFIATSLLDHCEPQTLTLLRQFRDRKLVVHPVGRLFVRFYYRTGWIAAKGLDRAPNFIRIRVSRVLDRIARAV